VARRSWHSPVFKSDLGGGASSTTRRPSARSSRAVRAKAHTASSASPERTTTSPLIRETTVGLLAARPAVNAVESTTTSIDGVLRMYLNTFVWKSMHSIASLRSSGLGSVRKVMTPYMGQQRILVACATLIFSALSAIARPHIMALESPQTRTRGVALVT